VNIQVAAIPADHAHPVSEDRDIPLADLGDACPGPASRRRGEKTTLRVGGHADRGIRPY
jgi:hypothetical protein